MEKVIYKIEDGDMIEIYRLDSEKFRNSILYGLSQAKGLLKDAKELHENTLEALEMRQKQIVPQSVIEKLKNETLDSEEAILLDISINDREFTDKSSTKALMRALRKEYGISTDILEAIEENECEQIAIKTE